MFRRKVLNIEAIVLHEAIVLYYYKKRVNEEIKWQQSYIREGNQY